MPRFSSRQLIFVLTIAAIVFAVTTYRWLFMLR